jgi:hypothetical protein
MFVKILICLSFVVADDCYSCFNTTASDAQNLTPNELLQFRQYWDPVKRTCGNEKNDEKHSLIFRNKESGIPKNWILNPKFCNSQPKEVDLAKAEVDWVLTQMAYAANGLSDRIPMEECIKDRYEMISRGQTPTTQADPSQFTPLTNIGFIERPADFRAKSQQSPGSTVNVGPTGVFWADMDGALVLSWRGTITDEQLKKEVEQVTSEYAKPIGNAFKDVQINGNKVGGVFDYFLSGFMDLWNDDKMNDLKTRAQNASSVKIMGHSLGGALASISAMFVAVELGIPGENIEFVTFGEPRMSDSTFAVNLNTLIPNQRRYVYAKDLVPHIPPMRNDMRNPQGSQSAFHHSQEVFLLKGFNDKNSSDFNKFHSCGYDDNQNENGEQCSNAVENFKIMAIGSSQAIYDHTHYWPQYHGICSRDTSTTSAQSTSESSDATESITSSPSSSESSEATESITSSPTTSESSEAAESSTSVPAISESSDSAESTTSVPTTSEAANSETSESHGTTSSIHV